MPSASAESSRGYRGIMVATCEILEWDSSFFGKRIARLGVRRLTAGALAELDDFVAKNQVECVYFLCEAMDAESIVLAEQHRFHLADIRVTLETRLGADGIQASEDLIVRKAAAGQKEALKAIARISHKDTRFYQDPHFQTSRCDALYETWIEKSCDGYADVVFTVELGGMVAGYITCHLDGEAAGNIGLLAVSEAARGKGVGSALIRAALNWFSDEKRLLVTVVTQGRNNRAQRLYQHSGFVTRSVELWYHYWPVA
jgi:dTDP-4-amino-4,6-dideoxy-D-galactose acyltransferase